MAKEVMIQQESETQTREELIKEQYKSVYDSLESEFPKKAEKCHRFYGRRGYKQRPPNASGKGGVDKQEIRYAPCPYPKCDEYGNLIGYDRETGKEIKGFDVKDTQYYQRCNYEAQGDTQKERQIDLIIHHAEHYKWYLDYFSLEEEVEGRKVTRPPLQTPNPWQVQDFPPFWGSEGDQYIQGEGQDFEIAKEKSRRKHEKRAEKKVEDDKVHDAKRLTEETLKDATRTKGK